MIDILLSLLFYGTISALILVALAMLAAWLGKLADWTRRTGMFAIFICIMVIWYQALWDTAAKQPEGYALSQIAVAKGSDDFSIGANMLLQNQKLPGSASEPHLGFSKVEASNWRISNISATRRLSLSYKKQESVSVDDSFFGKILRKTRWSETDTNTLSFNADNLLLSEGDQIFGTNPNGRSFKLEIEKLNTKSVDLKIGGISHRIGFGDDAGLVTVFGKEIADCPDGKLKKALRFVRNLVPSSKTRTIALIGGEHECRGFDLVYFKDLSLAFGDIVIRHIPNAGLSISSSANHRLFVKRNGQNLSLRTLDHPFEIKLQDELYQLDTFTAGHTRYKISHAPEDKPLTAFTITPVSGVHRLVNSEKPSIKSGGDGSKVVGVPLKAYPAYIEWTLSDQKTEAGTKRSSSHEDAYKTAAGNFVATVIAVLLIGYLALIFSGFWGITVVSASSIYRIACFALGVGIVVGSVSLFYLGESNLLTPRPAHFALFAWAVAGFAVVFAKGSKTTDTTLFLLWTAIVAFGHIAMVSLSLQMEETRFLRFSNDTSLAIGISAGVVVCVSQIPPDAIRNVLDWFSRGRGKLLGGDLPWAAFVSLGVLITGTWLLWVALGTETGIAGFFQPSEVIKTLFALALGVLLTFVLDRNRFATRTQKAMSPANVNMKFGRGAVFFSVLSIIAGLLVWSVTFLPLISFLFAISIFAFYLFFVNPFWRGFAMIGILVGFMLLAPVTRSDMSPILIIAFTTILTFAIASLMHLLAILNGWAATPSGSLWHVGLIPVRPVKPHPLLSRGSIWFRHQLKNRLPILTLPYIWLMLTPVAIIIIVGSLAVGYLQNGDETKQSLMNGLGANSGFLDVPIKRTISWVEFNALPNKPGDLVAVEFADTALQVDQSRKTIAVSPCNNWGSSDAVFSMPSGSEREEVIWNSPQSWVREGIAFFNVGARSVKAALLGSQCNLNTDNSVSSKNAIRIFAIQSDFVSTWLIAFFGRDGALIIGVLQTAMIGAMLLASFLILRWQPGMSEERPAANMAAFAVAAFAIMIALQWLISWANAFGSVPVMGQPSTFLSHGRSHFLFFGMPAIVFTISALRMRAAFSDVRPFWRNQKARDIPYMPIELTLGQWLKLRNSRK